MKRKTFVYCHAEYIFESHSPTWIVSVMNKKQGKNVKCLNNLVPCTLCMRPCAIVLVASIRQEHSFSLPNGFCGSDRQKKKVWRRSEEHSALQTADAPKISRFHCY